MTLFKFYSVFMILSLCLFSFENKSIEKKLVPGTKRAIEDSREDKISTPKKQFRHRFRSSNLC